MPSRSKADAKMFEKVSISGSLKVLWPLATGGSE